MLSGRYVLTLRQKQSIAAVTGGVVLALGLFLALRQPLKTVTAENEPVLMVRTDTELADTQLDAGSTTTRRLSAAPVHLLEAVEALSATESEQEDAAAAKGGVSGKSEPAGPTTEPPSPEPEPTEPPVTRPRTTLPPEPKPTTEPPPTRPLPTDPPPTEPTTTEPPTSHTKPPNPTITYTIPTLTIPGPTLTVPFPTFTIPHPTQTYPFPTLPPESDDGNGED